MKTPTFRSILAAADLTPASAEVIRAAAALALRTGARLHVVHACDLPVLVYGNAAAGGIAVEQRIQAAGERLAAHIDGAMPDGLRPASQEVRFGSPADIVIERAAEVEADLIVLGPHRPRPVGDLFLGSTADRVIRRAAAPCLVVRGEFALPLRRVMVPIDLSDPSRGALDLALGWTMGLGASDEGERVPHVEVTVAHVIPRIFGTDSFPFDREVVAPELGREIKGAVVRTGAGARVGICEKLIWGDVPAEELVSLAEQETPDLLVIATHGYGLMLRALIGSVASHVVRRAPCSVLLVPPNRWTADEPTVDAWAGIMRGCAPVAPLT